MGEGGGRFWGKHCFAILIPKGEEAIGMVMDPVKSGSREVCGAAGKREVDEGARG